ncbi:MAG: hypothetical protein AAGH74_09800 [Pseudomonadota bacterium]
MDLFIFETDTIDAQMAPETAMDLSFETEIPKTSERAELDLELYDDAPKFAAASDLQEDAALATASEMLDQTLDRADDVVMDFVQAMNDLTKSGKYLGIFAPDKALLASILLSAQAIELAEMNADRDATETAMTGDSFHFIGSGTSDDIADLASDRVQTARDMLPILRNVLGFAEDLRDEGLQFDAAADVALQAVRSLVMDLGSQLLETERLIKR